MSPTVRQRILSRSDRVYRRLLFVYPADHRNEYGRLMAQLFHDHCRDVLRQGRAATLINVWFNTLIDLITTAFIEHIAKLKGQAMTSEFGGYENTLLQSAAEVSALVVTCPDLNELTQQAVNLIRERLDLYYVGWFLVDQEDAVLQAGAGKVDPKMLEAGYRLAVGPRSMIGYSVSKAQACIALDVGEEAVTFRNPWLPKTRSELVLP